MNASEVNVATDLLENITLNLIELESYKPETFYKKILAKKIQQIQFRFKSEVLKLETKSFFVLNEKFYRYKIVFKFLREIISIENFGELLNKIFEFQLLRKELFEDCLEPVIVKNLNLYLQGNSWARVEEILSLFDSNSESELAIVGFDRCCLKYSQFIRSVFIYCGEENHVILNSLGNVKEELYKYCRDVSSASLIRKLTSDRMDIKLRSIGQILLCRNGLLSSDLASKMMENPSENILNRILFEYYEQQEQEQQAVVVFYRVRKLAETDEVYFELKNPAVFQWILDTRENSNDLKILKELSKLIFSLNRVLYRLRKMSFEVTCSKQYLIRLNRIIVFFQNLLYYYQNLLDYFDDSDLIPKVFQFIQEDGNLRFLLSEKLSKAYSKSFINFKSFKSSIEDLLKHGLTWRNDEPLERMETSIVVLITCLITFIDMSTSDDSNAAHDLSKQTATFLLYLDLCGWWRKQKI